MKMPIYQCKKWLASLWAGAFVMFVFLMLYETQVGPLADQPESAWGWMFQNLLPTLSLIVAVLSADATRPNSGRRTVDRLFMMLTFILSALSYIHGAGGIAWDPLEAMQNSNIYLDPLQGLTAATLGIFFTKQE